MKPINSFSEMVSAGLIPAPVYDSAPEYDFSLCREEKLKRKRESVNVALCLLDPKVIDCLIGGSEVSRKTLALIMHDRLMTGYPRSRINN